MKPDRVTRRGEGRAFALLVVLMILVMLAAVTVTMGYGIAAQSLAIGTRIEAVQNHHAMDAALSVIVERWARGEMPMQLLEHGHLRDEVQLGEHVVQYRIWDEATKIRFRPGSRDAVDVNRITQELDGIRLRGPLSRESLESQWEPMLFEEAFVVEPGDLEQFYGYMDERPALVDVVSLWGDGRVNLHTADEAILRLRFQDQRTMLIESVILARRYDRTQDLDRLIARMGLETADQRVVAVRLSPAPTTLTVRLACHGPTLRTDAFAVIDVRGTPELLFWRDLPPGRGGPETKSEQRRGV